MDDRSIVVALPDEPGSSYLALAPDLVESAAGYAKASKAKRTKQRYSQAWAAFSSWCSRNGRNPLPASPATVAAYLAARADAGVKPGTLGVELSAISQAHRTAGLESPRSAPEVRAVLAGIRRTKGVAPTKKAPVLATALRALLATVPANILGARDRALLLLGFGMAARRSELVALDVADLAFGDNGITVAIRRSKTDQEGEGATVGVPFGSDPATCPVRAVRAWLAAAGISEGAIFRPVNRHGRVAPGRLTDHAVARVVKRTVTAAGLDAAIYSGHSLRSGLATSAAIAGKGTRAIMRQGRWKSERICAGYIRTVDLFDDNAAGGIGL